MKSSAACMMATLLAFGCGDPQPDAPAETVSEVAELIYGADDRREVYQLVSATDLRLARSTVALLDAGAVAAVAGGYRLDTAQSFAQSYGVCADEPYRNQPNPAFCSGFQVGPDLIATAGHCVDAATCGGTVFVFGFEMIDAGTVRATVPVDDVYGCAQVLGRVETSTDDWAVVRVDRPIVGHDPLPIRRAGAVALGAGVTVAGHPVGLPLKVAGGATVRSTSHPNYFAANLDTYGGNSGSPVMGADGVVEGVLVRGNTDFVLAGKGRNRCYSSNVCPDSGCPGWEDASRTTRFAHLVPEGPGCADDAECTDGDPCNGAEACVGGACVAGAAPSCDDGDACTADACVALDATQWQCQSSAVACDDGDPCTVEFCDPVSGCGSTPLCAADEICTDGVCEQAPQCSPFGAACSSNAECCSGRCHSRHGCR